MALYSDNSCGTAVDLNLTSSTNSVTLSSDLTEGAHYFYHKVTRGTEISACSPPSLSYIYDNTAPAEPNSSYFWKCSLPHHHCKQFSNETIKFSVIATALAQNAEGNAKVSDGSSVALNLSGLTATDSPYTFYVAATDLAGNKSTCISVAHTCCD